MSVWTVRPHAAYFFGGGQVALSSENVASCMASRRGPEPRTQQTATSSIGCSHGLDMSKNRPTSRFACDRSEDGKRYIPLSFVSLFINIGIIPLFINIETRGNTPKRRGTGQTDVPLHFFRPCFSARTMRPDPLKDENEGRALRRRTA